MGEVDVSICFVEAYNKKFFDSVIFYFAIISHTIIQFFENVFYVIVLAFYFNSNNPQSAKFPE